MSGGSSGTLGGKNTEGGKTSLIINQEKQNKHIPGTKEYDPKRSSIDNISIIELEELIKSNINNAIDLRNGKLILDLPIVIGTYKNKDGTIIEKNK